MAGWLADEAVSSADVGCGNPGLKDETWGTRRQGVVPTVSGLAFPLSLPGRTNMEDLIQFCTQSLNKVPATFWGIVVGSLFTLTGVYLTNRASDRRLKLQLQNDRELRNREREMTFRKDTYAVAAEAISVSVNTLSKFSDLSFSLKEISATYIEKSPILAKS